MKGPSRELDTFQSDYDLGLSTVKDSLDVASSLWDSKILFTTVFSTNESRRKSKDS